MKLPDPSPISPDELARLALARFVAIDCETTGVDPVRGRVIELGAVRFEGGIEVARFSELVAIDQDLDPFITRLTGITDQDLDGKPRFEKLAKDFVDFLGDSPLVGQNVQFDISFIEEELKRLPAGMDLRLARSAVHDTLPLARAFFPTLPSYGLGALARQLGVELAQAHRAAEDAAATGRVLVNLLQRARRIPFGELDALSRLLGGAAFTLGALIDGLVKIGPGALGVEEREEERDNRVGDWGPDSWHELEPIKLNKGWFDDFFMEEEGPLHDLVPGYQRRDGQVEMAKDVYDTLKGGGALLAEGGTGTGKSFAYLLPSLLFARNEGKRVMVSTHTKHLQNQLFDKDLPTLFESLGGGMRAVLLKGRGNYVCRRRFESLIADPEALKPEERIALLPLVRWILRTKTGDIQEATAFRHGGVRSLWPRISADSGFCTSRTCRGSKDCFLHRIRSSAIRSHVVLVNHALLFSDLASEGGVLGEYSHVVFDEAHHLEKIAANHLGISWSISQVRAVLLQLYDLSAKRGVLTGLRAYEALVETPIERGEAGPGLVDKAMESQATALETGELFATELDLSVRHDAEGSGNGYSRKNRYTSGRDEFADLATFVRRHHAAMRDLDGCLNDLARGLDDLDLEPAESGDDVLAEFRRLHNEVKRLDETFQRLTGDEQENMVLWYEAPAVTSRQPVRLFGAPLNVSKVLQDNLYPRLEATVMTSATMTVNESFDYISGRLGLPDAEGKLYPSPFDMRGQLYIAIADFLGNPKQDIGRFTQGVGKLAWRLPEELDAGTLVLFTSQRMLQEAYGYASPLLEKDGWLTLAQGIGGSQAEMLEKFRLERKSVLFGVDSFWEGIDVPGESLELAIIARLPFDVPTEPLIAARGEAIQEAGGNPFMKYTLPEAALKLRQGIGRLIRTTGDVGAAVICDPRLVSSRWGKVIMNSLPVTPVVYKNYDDMARDLHAFLRSD